MSDPSTTPVMSSALQRIRIVLVGTQHPGNIGSAARALKTMGLSRLVLVAPSRFPHAEADALAAGADDVLAAADVHAISIRTPSRSISASAKSSSRPANR